jgi:hypothetical protein
MIVAKGYDKTLQLQYLEGDWEETAMFARLRGLSHGRQRGHVSFTCDGWYRYTGEEHNYDSDELPDLV